MDQDKNIIKEKSHLPKSFLDLLVTEKPFTYKFRKFKPRKIRNEILTYETDDQTKFRNSTAYARAPNSVLQNICGSAKNIGLKSFLKRKQVEKDMETQYEQIIEKNKIEEEKYPFDIIDWEKDIIYDTDNIQEDELPSMNFSLDTSKNVNNRENFLPSVTEFVDTIFEEKWEKNIIFDEDVQVKHKMYQTMYLEDPNLIFDKIDDKRNNKNKKRQKEYFSGDKPIKNKYNISNDKYYNQESKLKSNLGSFGVQHSVPALKLEPRFYKTNHTKDELRNFHRPPLVFPKGLLRFHDIIHKESSGSNIIKKNSELTLKDDAEFVLFEYSEEFPPFIVNSGMVSLINTYYRKTSTRDDYEADIPNLNVLDPDDPSPFFNFGDIKQGTTMKSLTNNLFTAPIFSHQNSDFLCILEKDEDSARLYARPINNIFCVGQEFPIDEIYAPHSRKLNIFCKNRLKVAAYRLFSSKDRTSKEFKISQLDQLFPYFSEGSKRKWLKEYADCIKRGKENVWILKPSSNILNEEDLRKLITPENICQYESMLASERRLIDSGYKCVTDSQDEEDDSMFIIPWQLTKNFINATNGKGLLELVGPADPTGIGEGFSFRKVKLIKGNETENRKIISEHQAKYKSEINKIWTKQISSLSSSREIEFDPKFEQSEDKKKEAQVPQSENTGLLIIRRTIVDEFGEREEIERITDSKVIKLYLKSRKNVNLEDKKSLLKCGNCGQAGHMKTNKTCPNFLQNKKPTKKKIETERRKARMIFQNLMLNLLNKFFSLPYSLAFHKPVSSKRFPDYHSVIENPIDLTTIKTKVRHNKYTLFSEFFDDLELMKNNCVKYNGVEHSLTKIAQNMCDMTKEVEEANKEKIQEAENIFIEYDFEDNEN
ncbi:transcription initiation factor TFIID subunit 1 (TAF1) [Vairimorpha necatrix]|uniref:Transcription initiation factor TFIID subunit 1 (TAF1) n=1 Tax=Vairimorpha necatrix TaxID=6039 RepID=A0AAX4JDS1_9MICR